MSRHVGDSDIEALDSDGSDDLATPMVTHFPLRPAPSHSPILRTPTRKRASSLPPLSSSGPVESSPIIGTHEEKKAIRRRKGQRKRAPKMEEIYAAKAQQQLQNPAIAETPADGLTAQQVAEIGAALRGLNDQGTSFRDLMLFGFDPAYKQGRHRWDFFRTRGTASKVLDFWVSTENSEQGREEVREWAVAHVASTVRAEARVATSSGQFQMANLSYQAPLALSRH